MNKLAASSHKEQLMQAFEKILADRKQLETRIATKQEEAEKEKNKQLLATASTYTVDGIVKGLADLQLEFGSIVNGLSEKLAAENSKLDELKQAIEIESRNLQELQQIRVVADALDILTQEHQEKLRILEQNTTDKRTKLEQEIIQTRKEWQQEQIEHESKLQADNEALAKERQQETEEYQYKLELTQKINADAYEGKKRNLERDLQASTQEKEKVWTEREKVLKANQTQFKEHQQKIAAYPAELEEAIKKAREEAIKDTTQKAKVESDLFEKEWEATKQNYELKIQALTEVVNRQQEQIEGISAQLQTALQQAQDLAMRAFANSAKS